MAHSKCRKNLCHFAKYVSFRGNICGLLKICEKTFIMIHVYTFLFFFKDVC